MFLLLHCLYSIVLSDNSIIPLFYSYFIVFVYDSLVFESNISCYSSAPWFHYFGRPFCLITRLLYSKILLDHSIHFQTYSITLSCHCIVLLSHFLLYNSIQVFVYSAIQLSSYSIIRFFCFSSLIFIFP